MIPVNTTTEGDIVIYLSRVIIIIKIVISVIIRDVVPFNAFTKFHSIPSLSSWGAERGKRGEDLLISCVLVFSLFIHRCSMSICP